MAGKRGLAEQVRVGLGEAKVVKNTRPQICHLDQRLHRKTLRQHVKEFGVLFAFIFIAIAGYLIWKQRAPFWTISLLLLACAFTWSAYRAPSLLYPFWKGWMKLAEGLSFVVTGFILVTSWLLIIVPMAIILRLIQKKVMDCRYKADVNSYWEERDSKKNDFKLLDKQF